jgi:short subunit fatty acids transporter
VHGQEPARLDFWRYWVFENPKWDWHTFAFDRDLAYAERKLQAVNASSPNLEAFKARGGKLIVYHGWVDPVGPPSDSIDYFEKVQSVVGGSEPRLAFFRLSSCPACLRYLAPTEANPVVADPERLKAEDIQKVVEVADTLGALLDHAWVLNLLLVLFGVFAVVLEFKRIGGGVDLNSVIMTLLMAGLLLHWTPAAYIAAVKNAARITGPLILQYPLYGGLMGIITTTGLAGVLSKVFIKYSTAHTLPFFTYLTSLIITLFVPSGGGHWAVQGPFAIPAARDLHASLAGTTMAVAMGESVANMLQPFFALPILAIAGIRMRRMSS